MSDECSLVNYHGSIDGEGLLERQVDEYSHSLKTGNSIGIFDSQGCLIGSVYWKLVRDNDGVYRIYFFGGSTFAGKGYFLGPMFRVASATAAAQAVSSEEKRGNAGIVRIIMFNGTLRETKGRVVAEALAIAGMVPPGPGVAYDEAWSRPWTSAQERLELEVRRFGKGQDYDAFIGSSAAIGQNCEFAVRVFTDGIRLGEYKDRLVGTESMVGGITILPLVEKISNGQVSIHCPV